MSEEDQPSPARLWRERLYATLALTLLILFAVCSGLITVLEAPLRLVFGWALHAWVTLPPLLPRWKELLLPLAALGLALWLIDRFIRWGLAAKGSELRWQGRHTLSATFLLLFGAAAAIAMSGIVHQVVWLGAERWWDGRPPVFQQAVAVGNARQILIALEAYEEKNGRYPESLAELDLPDKLLRLPVYDRGLPEPYVYLKPTELQPAGAGEEVAVIVSPVLPHLDRVAVGYLSGTATTVPANQLSELLSRTPSSGP